MHVTCGSCHMQIVVDTPKPDCSAENGIMQAEPHSKAWVTTPSVCPGCPESCPAVKVGASACSRDAQIGAYNGRDPKVEPSGYEAYCHGNLIGCTDVSLDFVQDLKAYYTLTPADCAWACEHYNAKAEQRNQFTKCNALNWRRVPPKAASQNFNCFLKRAKDACSKADRARQMTWADAPDAVVDETWGIISLFKQDADCAALRLLRNCV